MSDQNSHAETPSEQTPADSSPAPAYQRAPEQEAAARRRFLVISLSRLVGIGFVLLGLLFDNKVLEGPEWLKFMLLAVGVMIIFITPRYLARKWRTPRP